MISGLLPARTAEVLEAMSFTVDVAIVIFYILAMRDDHQPLGSTQ